MIKGIYNAASGLVVNQQKLNITANNLANVNTTGFKKDQTVQRSFRETMLHRLEKNKEPVGIGEIGNGVALDGTYTDHQQGNLRETSNSLDLAIEGSGFFVVQTPAGLRYTRNGNFTLNEQGQIVTQQGYLVMGERGPMQTINGRAIDIDTNGQLHLEGILGDRFQIVDIADPQLLEKEGENLYTIAEEQTEEAANFQIRQGFLENSNVNIVKEMVKMIELNRAFEANQKVVTTMDNTLDKAVNVVGRLG